IGKLVAPFDYDPSWGTATLTSGDYTVGKELSATLDFTDQNGTTLATPTYIWYRTDGVVWIELQRSTDSSYTLT
ncbi:MAG: hypothetical protein VW907_09610, partial [Opitutae bacterium]